MESSWHVKEHKLRDAKHFEGHTHNGFYCALPILQPSCGTELQSLTGILMNNLIGSFSSFYSDDLASNGVVGGGIVALA